MINKQTMPIGIPYMYDVCDFIIPTLCGAKIYLFIRAGSQAPCVYRGGLNSLERCSMPKFTIFCLSETCSNFCGKNNCRKRAIDA
jgi:hypothetical protein